MLKVTTAAALAVTPRQQHPPHMALHLQGLPLLRVTKGLTLCTFASSLYESIQLRLVALLATSCAFAVTHAKTPRNKLHYAKGLPA